MTAALAGARPDLEKASFPPIVGRDPRVLVLGTLPGEESLRRVEYYAHPRNLFWPIVFALFDTPPAAAYDERVAFAMARRIAVWDVVARGRREMSADATIRAETANPIHQLLDRQPGIATVAFNGSGARRLYLKHFRPRPGVVYLALPSTSPAHARLGFAEKLGRWRALREALGR